MLPPATQVAAPPPLSARGPDRGRAALDALLWQGMQELRDAYHVLAAERRPAPRPPPVVEALAPATERPSARAQRARARDADGAIGFPCMEFVSPAQLVRDPDTYARKAPIFSSAVRAYCKRERERAGEFVR